MTEKQKIGQLQDLEAEFGKQIIDVLAMNGFIAKGANLEIVARVVNQIQLKASEHSARRMNVINKYMQSNLL